MTASGRPPQADAETATTRIAKVTTVYSQGRFEQVSTSIAVLGRSELKSRIKNFRGRFKLDFTDDYLDAIDTDRLRHILLAALITAKSHH
jgi:hypothetical protein